MVDNFLIEFNLSWTSSFLSCNKKIINIIRSRNHISKKKNFIDGSISLHLDNTIPRQSIRRLGIKSHHCWNLLTFCLVLSVVGDIYIKCKMMATYDTLFTQSIYRNKNCIHSIFKGFVYLYLDNKNLIS